MRQGLCILSCMTIMQLAPKVQCPLQETTMQSFANTVHTPNLIGVWTFLAEIVFPFHWKSSHMAILFQGKSLSKQCRLNAAHWYAKHGMKVCM